MEPRSVCIEACDIDSGDCKTLEINVLLNEGDTLTAPTPGSTGDIIIDRSNGIQEIHKNHIVYMVYYEEDTVNRELVDRGT